MTFSCKYILSLSHWQLTWITLVSTILCLSADGYLTKSVYLKHSILKTMRIKRLGNYHDMKIHCRYDYLHSKSTVWLFVTLRGLALAFLGYSASWASCDFMFGSCASSFHYKGQVYLIREDMAPLSRSLWPCGRKKTWLKTGYKLMGSNLGVTGILGCDYAFVCTMGQ